jgi:hypothetical protein
MSLFKTGTILALTTILVSAAPAFARKDGTDWLAMMERLRHQRAADAYAREQPTPLANPQINKSRPEWRYFGGPKGGLWPAR